MGVVSEADVREALEMSADVAAAPDLLGLRRSSVRAAARLVHGEVACWYDWHPGGTGLAVVSDPPELATPALATAVERAATAHPIAGLHCSGVVDTVISVSDLLSDRQLRRTPLGPVFRTLGTRREVSVALPAQDGVACIAVYRLGRDFDPAERRRLGLLRAQIAAAVRLHARCALAEGRRRSVALDRLLTEREAAVLDALVHGLTHAEAASRLSVSIRTVHKHAEHVYRKLGVTTRAAAVAVATGNARRPRASSAATR